MLTFFKIQKRNLNNWIEGNILSFFSSICLKKKGVDCLWADIGFFFGGGGEGGGGRKGGIEARNEKLKWGNFFVTELENIFLTELLIVYRSAWRFSEMSDSVVR